jgi:autotransporter-associated beta strand protein
MKTKSTLRMFLLGCSSLLVLPSASAATYYWDNNGTTAGFGTAAGTWAAPTTGDSTQGWSTSSVGTAAPGASITTFSANATTDAVNFGFSSAGNGLASGTITVSGTVQSGNITFGSQSGSVVLSGGTINVPSTATTNLTVNSTTAPSTIASDLTGGSAGVTVFVQKAGNGTLYVSGNNSYVSGTIAAAGVLVLDSATALPGSGLTISNGIVGLGAYGTYTRLIGATSTYATTGMTYWKSNGGFAAYGANRNVNLGGANGYVVFGGGAVGAVVGSMNGKTLILGAADATHTLNWQNGLDIGSGIRGLTVNNGPAAVDAEMSGGIRGAAGAGLNKGGTGTLLISSANTQTGPINLNAGTIMVGDSSALGSSSASTIVANGAVLDLNGFSVANASALTLSGTGISSSGCLTNSSATPSSHVGPVTFGNATIQIGGTGTISLSNPSPIVGTDSNLTLAGAGGSLGGDLQTGAGTLTVNTTGTWSLFGTNTYTGATSVNGGTLALFGTASINGSSGITVNALGAKLRQASSVALTPTVTLTQGTLTGTGAVNTVDVGDATGGIISNNNGTAGASLTIGTLTFNGAATVSTFSNSTSAPIATTTLATNAAGNVTINASSTGWTDNTTHDLISYVGPLGGPGSSQFVLGTVSGLSARQVASPTLGDSGTAITLAITGDTPYWTGSGDGKWNTGSTNNWQLVSDNSLAVFLTNDNALFNDSATGAGPITVDIDLADVAPNSTVFNNITKDYVLNSTGGFGISSAALVMNGAGKLTINNANTYTGGTTVNAGTLVLGNANAIGTGLLTLNGGNLDSSVSNLVNAGNNAQLWKSDFTFVGTESLNLGTGPVTLNGNRTVTVSANNLTIGGAIGGGAFNLTKLGTGTLILTTGSTFTGTLAVNAGTLALSPATAGAFTLSNGLSGAGVLNVNPFNANSSDLSLVGDLSGFTGTVNIASSGGFNSKLATTGATSSFGVGAVVNIASGATWYSAANQTGITVNVTGTGNSDNFGALRVEGATLDATSSVVLKSDASIGGTATINAPISEDGGSFSLTKQGGTLVLGGTNSYSGLTTVNSGVLVVTNPGALGTTAGGTFVADGTRVQLENLTVTGEPITVTGAGGDTLGALRSGSGNCIWTGPITINAELTRIGALAGTTMEFSGVIDDGPNDYRVRFRPNNSTATVIVSGANTYTGGTSVFGGTVVTSSFNSVVGGSPSSNFGAPVTEANGMIIIGIAGSSNNPILSYLGAGETTDRTIQIGDNSAAPVVGDNGAGTIENNGTSGALVFSAPAFNTPTNAVTGISPTRVFTLGGTNTGDNTISGVIQNNQIAGNPTAAVALTKAGVGTWRLTGANTYTGATTVSQGTLALIGGSQSSPITVSSGASLAFDLASPTASTSGYNLSAGTIKIIGTPTLANYTLTTSSGITGTPTLDAPITGYALVVESTTLKLKYVPYESWATGFPSLTDIDSLLDFDGDGLSTGIEYVLGGNPTVNDAASIAPSSVYNGSGLVFTYRRTDLANSDANATISVTYSTDLQTWTTAQDAVAGVSIVATDDFYGVGTDRVVVTLPPSLAAGGKLFARLGVSGLPATLLSQNFESGDGGFTVATASGTPWAHGVPNSTGFGGTISTGNGASAKCWGTGIGNPGFYLDPTDTRLRSPVIDLTGMATANLSFAHAIDLHSADSVEVNIINATTDTVISSNIIAIIDGDINSANWTNVGPIAIPALALGQPVRIEWHLSGVGSSTDDYMGWYIDDVKVNAKP